MVSLCSYLSVSRSKKLIRVEELLKDEKTSKVNLGTMSQSMCSALQLALVDLLQSWGLQPDKVVGHSSGEIAAAYAIGALSFENCLKIAYYRGIASDNLTKNHPKLEGGMIAIGASAEHVSTLLESVTEGKVVIACFLGPSSITVSGDNAGIEQPHYLLTNKGIFSRKLRVAHAYHSHHMALVESTYRKFLGRIHTTNDFKGEMWSSVTAERIDPKILNDEYWVNNLLAPARFSQSLDRLLGTCTSDSTSLIEVGPHSALRGPVEDLLTVLHKSHQTLYASTLFRLQSTTKIMLDLAGKLFCQGHKIKMSAVNLRHKATSEDVLTNLPPYVWKHSQRFWHETRYAQEYLNRAESRSDFSRCAITRLKFIRAAMAEYVKYYRSPLGPGSCYSIPNNISCSWLRFHGY
jgi:acyl transferase domain-containing protein